MSMKAEVKSTGEIVDILIESGGYYGDNHGHWYHADDLNFIEIIDEKEDTCDIWEQRRYEISKDILNTLIAKSIIVDEQTLKNIDIAVTYADTLIKKLKDLNGTRKN